MVRLFVAVCKTTSISNGLLTQAKEPGRKFKITGKRVLSILALKLRANQTENKYQQSRNLPTHGTLKLNSAESVNITK